MSAWRTTHGNFVAGLTQKDFRILDNGVEQPVTIFLAGRSARARFW